MEKFKICPSCNRKNEPVLLECIYCESDLTGVKISDGEAEDTAVQADACEPAEKLVRVCECGAENPPNARKCSTCGEDISDITPALAVKTNEFVFSSADGRCTYTITSGEAVIGRENVMSEYLSSKSYVSRAHAKLTVNCGELFIENLSATNFTYINNRKTNGAEKLSDGDEIGLGGKSLGGNRQTEAAYFIVRKM